MIAYAKIVLATCWGAGSTQDVAALSCATVTNFTLTAAAILDCYDARLYSRSSFVSALLCTMCPTKAVPSSEDLVMTTLNVSKTLLVLSASMLLVATCAALAKTGTIQRVSPVFPQRALTIEEFPALFTVVSP